MPLVVPALRFLVVFLNVYETFKTLKPPPPSARRGGQPSVRAITQRKRDLKGCLAVWVVWCCYAVHERTFDRLVGIFLPFYSEIKSVFLLFLVLTRAKGAEPLFLHVLRPFVKPYAVVVDPLLDVSRDVGDFFFALLQVPLDYILASSWLPSWHTDESEEEPEKLPPSVLADSASSTRKSSHPDIEVPVDPMRTSRAQTTRSEFVRSISDNHYSNGHPPSNNLDSRASRDRRLESASTTSLPAYSDHPSYDPPRYSQTLPRRNGHQIWYPPASAYNQEMPAAPLDLPTAPEYRTPEWRSYPAFPSAYPPTPLPASNSLPGAGTRMSDDRYRVAFDAAHPPIPENEQDFGELLGRQHEGYPDSVRGSSSSKEMAPGVSSCEPSRDITRQQDEDNLDDSMCSSEAGLSEDDFGPSLRTPHRPLATMPSGAYSSTDSLPSAFTTTDNTRPLRAKTSSDSLSSGSSSLAGRKRTHGALQTKVRKTSPIPESRNATLRGRPAPPSIPQALLRSNPSESEDESEFSDHDGSTKSKKQKVLDPLKRKSTARPAVGGAGSSRKALPSRGSAPRGHAIAAVTHTTLRSRAGSVTAKNSTIKGRKPTLVSRQAVRNGPQGVIKSSSTSSSQSGILNGRVY